MSILVISAALAGLLVLGYVKASPDKAIIISGLRKEPRILVGKAGYKIPFFERTDELELGMLKIDVKTREPVKNAEFIDVSVDAVATVKLSIAEDMQEAALKNFLNKDSGYVSAMVEDVLEGNIREIIGSMTLEEMVKDRKKFAESVSTNAVPDMNKMGIEVISINIQSFSDGNGVLTDLGMDNTMKIRKDAAVVKANAERDIAIAQSLAEKESNDVRVKSATEIAEKNNELKVREAELEVITSNKKAEADCAYDIQKEIQRKQFETTLADANLEKETKNIEIKAKEVETTRETLKAQIEQKAISERAAAQEKADAELYMSKKQAEAETYFAEQKAIALKAQAEAERFAVEEGAKGIEAKLKAEAEGIKAKLKAEAEGIGEKAEAMKKYGEAAIMEMYFNTLPEVARAVAEPLNSIDSITMYGEGNSAKMTEDITKTIKQVMDGVQDGTGIDLTSLMGGLLGGSLVNKLD